MHIFIFVSPASCQLQMMMEPSCYGCNFAAKPKKMNLFSESTRKLLFSPYTTSSVAFSQLEDQFETNYCFQICISAIQPVNNTPISVALKNKSTDCMMTDTKLDGPSQSSKKKDIYRSLKRTKAISDNQIHHTIQKSDDHVEEKTKNRQRVLQ